MIKIKNKKNIVIISLGVILLVIGVVCICFINNDEDIDENVIYLNEYDIIDYDNKENVKIKNGNKYNISDKVSQEHVYNGYSFTDFEIYTNQSLCYFKFKITNLSVVQDGASDENILFIKFVNKNNEVIFVMGYEIPDLKINESKEEIFDIPIDSTNAFDYIIEG